MPFTFSQKLIEQAIEEVAEKHRATSRASEEVIQNVARQLVACAYEFALRQHHDNFPLKANEMRRDTLVHLLTDAGISQTTAEQIVDTDILQIA